MGSLDVVPNQLWEVEMSDLVDLAVIKHRETEKAWLVSDTGESKDGVWIPKSQAELYEGQSGSTLTCPEWLATEKGLV